MYALIDVCDREIVKIYEDGELECANRDLCGRLESVVAGAGCKYGLEDFELRDRASIGEKCFDLIIKKF